MAAKGQNYSLDFWVLDPHCLCLFVSLKREKTITHNKRLICYRHSFNPHNDLVM